MVTRRIGVLLLFTSVVLCYDTGHHNDLTRNTLQLFGYNEYAQAIGGISNFFVDYFSFTPIPTEELPELRALHFDNMFTLKNVSNYWTQLALNSKSAIQTAATNGDLLDYIMTVGGTLHTVQDFYTHTNWVDSHYRTECDCYRSETWLGLMHSVNGDYTALIQQQAAIHSYSGGDCNEDSRNCFPAQLPHGDACGGLNKDSYVRPYWEQGYAFAFSASVEWLDNIHMWVEEITDASFIAQAKAYIPPTQRDIDDMNDLTKYLQIVSYALKWGDNNGHWKGPGSGSLTRFVPAQAEFSASTSIYKSRYLDQKIYLRWAEPNVYDAAGVDPVPTIDTTTITAITRPYSRMEQFTPVVVRTVSFRGPDKLNTPSYYAIVNIDGLELVETVLIDESSFTPHWTSIKFVNSSASGSASIVYTLKNNHYPLSDDVVSITAGGNDSLTMEFDISSHALSGDAVGTYDSITNTFSTENANQGVTVQLFVTANRIASCTEGLPQQYCPNEAYVFAGAFADCEGPTISSGSSVNALGFTLLVVVVWQLRYLFDI